MKSPRRRVPRLSFALLFALALVVSFSALSDAPPARKLDLDDLARLVRVSDPQPSPDGRSVVLVVSRVNAAENRHDANLVLVDVASGATRVLTRDRRGVRHPRFSPSGDRLAFLAQVGSGKDAAAQLFVLPMNGGDALRLTNLTRGVSHFAWRPDGKALAFAAPDEPKDPKAAEKGEDAFEIENGDFLLAAAPAPVHVWLVNAEGGDARRLTSGAWSLHVAPPPSAPPSPLSFSPDGKSLLLTAQPSPWTGDTDRTQIRRLDIESGKLEPFTGRSAWERFATFSPDGSKVAHWYPRGGEPSQVNEIVVAPASGGEGRSATAPLDRMLYLSRWMPDSKALLVGGNDQTRVSLWLQPLDGAATRLDLGRLSPSGTFGVDANVGAKGEIFFVASEPSRPAELYLLPAPGAPVRRLTDFNAEVAARALGKTERVTWKTHDGFTADGVVTFPPHFTEGKRHPLVLVVHGGPRAASLETFGLVPQLLAARGYLVFEPNYRGSDNLGNAFMKAITGDPGEGPGRDVMAGLAELKKRPYVDGARVGVSGWSYGGFMTTWLLGHYGGWKAAVAGASVTDWVDQYTLSDVNVRVRHALGGSPYAGATALDAPRKKGASVYVEGSPITNAAKIRTPTLVLSDTGDARVPITQSYKLFRALKDNGVPTKFVAFPVSGHSPSDPAREKEMRKRWLAWLDEWMGAAER